MPKKLKVFHGLVNYGTQAGLLASQLRKEGIQAVSVVNNDPFKRQTDIELKKTSKWWQKFYVHSYNYAIKLYCFFKYNTFHFYFGNTLFPNQLDLPFYKFFNKKVIMEYLGNDIRHYESLVKRYNLPETHDYYQNVEEHDNKTRKRVHAENKHIDYLISCLPTHVDFAKEYGIEVKEVLPLALDIQSIVYKPLEKKKSGEPLTILHAPTNRVFKGTTYIEEAIEELKRDRYDIEFRLVEGVTHEELFEEYKNCDIFIDQISVGWFGTAALEAMAVGRPTCAFIDDRYYQYIDYSDEIPIINVTKENISNQLKSLIEKKDDLPGIGDKSRKFVENYHNVDNVSKKLLSIYEEKVWNKEYLNQRDNSFAG